MGTLSDKSLSVIVDLEFVSSMWSALEEAYTKYSHERRLNFQK